MKVRKNVDNIKLKDRFLKRDASSIFLIGFFGIIMVGAFLLMLPISSQSGKVTGFVTALFTATSAVCVTGLVVVETYSHWSVFGKTVIMLLIQIGGIGFMSLVTIISLVAGKKITLKERLVIQQAFNLDGLEGLVKLMKNVFKVTLGFEIVAAIILSLKFYFTNVYEYSVIEAIALGVFHSISAFCNAGFAIFPGESLIPFKTDIVVNVVISVLIIVGGLGVSVWRDVIKLVKTWHQKKNMRQRLVSLTLHTKMALIGSIVLLLFGFFAFLLIEFNNSKTIGNESFFGKTILAMFYSVTLRTAGFNTFSLADLTPASKFISVILMLIGGSPGGTAGGLKTVTLFTVIVIVINTIRGNDQIVIFRKKIPSALFNKALTIIIVYLSIFLFATVLLLIDMPEAKSLDLTYEVASALGTVGVTTNITPMLSVFGRFVIMICMFIGRLGPITLAVALLTRQSENRNVLDYPEENVMLG